MAQSQVVLKSSFVTNCRAHHSNEYFIKIDKQDPNKSGYLNEIGEKDGGSRRKSKPFYVV